MTCLILAAAAAAALVTPAGAASGQPAAAANETSIILPVRTEANTSDLLAHEATLALAKALKKDGVLVAEIDPRLPGARTCAAQSGSSASACAAVAAASGARFAFAGSLHAYAYMTRANLPIRLTLTLLDVRTGRTVWRGVYGEGWRGSFTRAVSAYSDIQLGARALADSVASSPLATRISLKKG